MSKINIKICGLKAILDVKACMDSGVDIIGFVVDYPITVPWNLSGEEAAKLLSSVNITCKTCIVTGGEIDKIVTLAKKLSPDLVQLHYNETLNDTIEISNKLSDLDVQVIKTMPLTEEAQIHQFGTADIAKIVNELNNTDIFAILVDARTPSNVNESKHEANLDFFTKIKSLSSKPVILAGGITHENVNDILNLTKANFIDVMTGVEHSPGIKDLEKLDKLMSAIKAN